MGLVLDDNDKGVHGEIRSKSITLYADNGDDGTTSIEMDYDQVPELIMLVKKIEKHLKEKGVLDKRGKYVGGEKT